jgi:type I restriction enzyme S subunit
VSVHELTLDQLGGVARGRSRHRPRDAAFLFGGPFPFIQTGDVKRANLYLTDYEQTYSDAGLAQSRLWPAGTLCITIAANIADTAILGIDACFPDSVIGFTADPEKADTRFVKYLFDAVLKTKYRSFTQGAAQDNLSQDKLLSIKFPVPELRLQRRIADILSAYDDLIENDRRRIALLEDAARMLYREWFVRFRFPGHEHVKIIEGLPEGWERRKLGSLLNLQRGFDLPLGARVSGGVSVYGSTGIVGEHNTPKVSFPTLITGRSGSLGTVCFVDDPCWPLNTSLWVTEFKAVSVYFAYFMLSEMNLAKFNGGASVPTLDRKVVHGASVVVAPQFLATLFDEQAQVLFAQKKVLNQQNQKLAQARDLLLPRLMNGEIAI